MMASWLGRPGVWRMNGRRYVGLGVCLSLAMAGTVALIDGWPSYDRPALLCIWYPPTTSADFAMLWRGKYLILDLVPYAGYLLGHSVECDPPTSSAQARLRARKIKEAGDTFDYQSQRRWWLPFVVERGDPMWDYRFASSHNLKDRQP